MIIEQPPILYRSLFPGARWRIEHKSRKLVYLTFDDGPIPDITQWVLDILDEFDIKATFFCVGDNVRKYPHIYNNIIERGNQVGNHTFNHLQGLKHSNKDFVDNANLAKELIGSTLFRPPHGHMKPKQSQILQKEGYEIIMWDVVTRDYSNRVSPQKVFANVQQYVRNGSIVVFHDSLKSKKNLMYSLPLSIEWLLKQGYEFDIIRSKKTTISR